MIYYVMFGKQTVASWPQSSRRLQLDHTALVPPNAKRHRRPPPATGPQIALILIRCPRGAESIQNDHLLLNGIAYPTIELWVGV